MVSATSDALGHRRLMFWITAAWVLSSPRLPPPMWCKRPIVMNGLGVVRCERRLPPESSSRHRAHLVQRLLCRLLAALECFVGPEIAPVAVPAAVGDAELIEIPVDRRQRGGAIEVEDDVGVLQHHGRLEQDRV